MHDALRDAYWGVAALPAPQGVPWGGASVRFSSDSVHISAPPARLTSVQVGGQGEGGGAGGGVTTGFVGEGHDRVCG